jgi:isopentenyldiphosphate isomerase
MGWHRRRGRTLSRTRIGETPDDREVDGIDPGDEVLDVVDEEDRVVGQATRREVRAGRLLHRFSSVLCRDPAGRLYVHRRTDDKDVYPGMYDTAAGGVLAAGETYLEAARRELAEELGVAGPEPRFLFKHRYRGQENPSWSALYEVTWDGPVRPQASEIAWGAFLTLEELDARLQEWPFCPDGLEIYRRWQAQTGAATARPKRR